MKTRQLYYENVYCKEFTAQVLECRQRVEDWEVLLDRTAFYPEGGGQSADTGFLFPVSSDSLPEEPGVRVLDVREKDGRIYHYTEAPFTPGMPVLGRIDWDRRFDLMQQHTGEHIVSGLIHEAFGYDNKGFHMGSDVITIDINGLLSKEDLAGIEEQACRIVWENRPVEVLYPSKQDLDSMNYRSKKELTGQIRIVRIPGADTCACCGTHVASTGEIGMIRILSAVKFREGVRIEMICGNRVRSYLNMLQEQNHEISVCLSAKPDRTAAAVRRLQEEAFALRGRVHELEESVFLAKAGELTGAGDVLLFEKGLEADSVRRLADAVTQTCGGRCAVFSDNGDGTYKYAVGQQNGDLRSFTKEMNRALDGRGGGKPFFVQGSVRADEAKIRAFFG